MKHVLRMKELLLSLLLAVLILPMEASSKPLKVYILAGQSNMQGQSDARTLAGMAMDPQTKPLYDKLVDKDGVPRVFENVYIAAFSQTGAWGAPVVDQEKCGLLTVGYGNSATSTNRLGPELAFGASI
jgi:alpha-galactosidase